MRRIGVTRSTIPRCLARKRLGRGTRDIEVEITALPGSRERTRDSRLAGRKRRGSGTRHRVQQPGRWHARVRATADQTVEERSGEAERGLLRHDVHGKCAIAVIPRAWKPLESGRRRENRCYRSRKIKNKDWLDEILYRSTCYGISPRFVEFWFVTEISLRWMWMSHARFCYRDLKIRRWARFNWG